MPLSKLRVLGEPRRPSGIVSIVIFVVAVGLMGYFRLAVYGDRNVTLTYGLPLLLCFLHPDRRLLWSMAGAFLVMSAYKAYYLMPTVAPVQSFSREANWFMQVANVVIIGGAVHIVLGLNDRLRAQTARVDEVNRELRERDEEISAQNEELAQQSEEVQQQSEELQTQSEELAAINAELAKREKMLTVLLGSLRSTENDTRLLENVCRSMLDIFDGEADAAAVLERDGDDLVVVAHVGVGEPIGSRSPFERSFSSIVLEQNATAFLEDLRLRPDLRQPPLKGADFRSVLAAPLRLNGVPRGAVKVYSRKPRPWTKEQFQLIEWVSAQCSLILEARRLQNELLQANTNLTRTVEQRTAELQDLVNELEHFSYTITHDLRAPLRAMNGYARLLSEEAAHRLEPEARDYLHRISTSAARMDRLIMDALSYSKAVRQELALTPVDSGRLLEGMIDSYPVFQLPYAKIEILGPLPRLLGNEAALTQCFSNILGNAVKFVEKGRMPHVRIRAERRDSLVRLWFEDNGIGIPKEMQSRVFVMFQRLSKDYEGTGIGLALVRKVAERMGGRVGVESEPGQGSRFWVELKAASEESVS
ncbi:hypothetical protein DB347_05405 [Opitutaceae bacterium EW11]|nr:hypothetical protein DB347_05405 [Opitutaceae bacterium EW11]